MKNIVIGTAGHIDHGKTTLVKYLTGKDTDTLPDEKKRGITIDIGFSYIDMGNGIRVGLVDVPGHEKFVKNMTAGVSGIDYLILTVACDDGIMPQTEEHFKIAELLEIKKGIVVLTKTDLAEKERVNEVRNKVKKLVKNSFLENAETIEVSIKNPSSYENLKNTIIKDIENIKISQKEDENKDFRMYIDRCFSVKGFGTVVTGTSLSGKISVGDTVNIYPLKAKSKIKGIEVHGEKKEYAERGNRVALNLSGIEKSQIKRGDFISSDENFAEYERVDIMFTALNNVSVKNNQRIRLHIGTREVIGRIRFFGKDMVSEKGRYPAQLLLEEKITGIYGELGIIRNFSPIYTVGGIKILNILGEKTKRDNKEYIEKLLKLDRTGESSTENSLNCKYLKNILEEFHEKNRIKRGILRAELKNRYFSKESIQDFRNFITENINSGLIKSETVLEKEYISLAGFKIKLTKEEKLLKDTIFKKYKEYMFSPEKYSLLKNETDDKNFDIIHNYMAEEKMLIPLSDEVYILRGYLKEAEKQIQNFLNENKKITISEFREIFQINRKSALLILEKLDNMEITERVSDYRILKNKI